MSTRDDVIRRAQLAEPTTLPEPWDAQDDETDFTELVGRERLRQQGTTDADGRGLRPAWQIDFARKPDIPDAIKANWTRPTSARVLGDSGKYESVPADEPRLQYDGAAEGLLVEAASRTNHVPFSSDFDNSTDTWETGLGASISGTATSLIEGETANVFSGGSDANAQIFQPSGTFSGGAETGSVILEQKGASKVGFSVEDTTNGGKLIGEYDFGTSSTNQATGGSPAGSIDGLHAREVSGKNGDTAVIIVLRYSGFTGGANRRTNVHPDRDGNSGDVYAHHAQIEEAPNASSPIVTGSSAVTRGIDDYAISDTGWLNQNEGTWILEFTTYAYYIINFSFILNSSSGGGIQFGGDPIPTKVLVNNSEGANPSVQNILDPFTPNTVAASLDGKKIIISADGKSSVEAGDISLRNDPSFLLGDDTPVLFSEVSYIPRALSESTLNNITS